MSPVRAAQPGSSSRHSSLGQPLEVLIHPDRAVPRLFDEQGTFSLVGFPAVSGIFVAYLLARGMALGDRLGFWPVVVGVVAGGAVLGLVALWFAGSLPGWSAVSSEAADVETGHMFAIFSEATWPFLPALLILATLEFTFYGTATFSAERGAVPGAVFWLSHGVVLVAIALWLFMMVRATAVARHESNGRAAGELGRWGAELLAIGVLFALILMASVMYW